jgi:hypothetical protein
MKRRVWRGWRIADWAGPQLAPMPVDEVLRDGDAV